MKARCIASLGRLHVLVTRAGLLLMGSRMGRRGICRLYGLWHVWGYRAKQSLPEPVPCLLLPNDGWGHRHVHDDWWYIWGLTTFRHAQPLALPLAAEHETSRRLQP